MKSAFLTISVLLALTPLVAQAQSSPVGLWRAVDDDSGKPQAEVMISESSGMLTGRVVRILEPLGDTAVCELCTDERHNKPIVGLDIIRNVKSAGDATTWAGGEILDPDTGKSYALKLQLLAGGQMLKVHGYIGPFYRNQYWQRIPDAASKSN